MRSHTILAKSTLLFAACAILSLCSFAQDPASQKDTAVWRAQHTADLLKPDGWLSPIGLEWLRQGDTSPASAPDSKTHLAPGPPHLGILRLEGETEVWRSGSEMELAVRGGAER